MGRKAGVSIGDLPLMQGIYDQSHARHLHVGGNMSMVGAMMGVRSWDVNFCVYLHELV